GAVNAVHLGGLHDDVGLDLQGPQGGGRVGGEIRTADARAENDDPVLLQVPDHPSPNERFGQGLDLDGRNVTGLEAFLLQGLLEGDAVDDGGQQAHLVGRRPVHARLGAAEAPEDIAAADHDGDLDAQGAHVLDL